MQSISFRRIPPHFKHLPSDCRWMSKGVHMFKIAIFAPKMGKFSTLFFQVGDGWMPAPSLAWRQTVEPFHVGHASFRFEEISRSCNTHYRRVSVSTLHLFSSQKRHDRGRKGCELIACCRWEWNWSKLKFPAESPVESFLVTFRSTRWAPRVGTQHLHHLRHHLLPTNCHGDEPRSGDNLIIIIEGSATNKVQ